MHGACAIMSVQSSRASRDAQSLHVHVVRSSRALNILSIEGVSVTFGTGPHALLAVDDVSLDVKSGEFLCLLGPSGCGKSTLLKAVAGLVHPQRGNVTIAGNGAQRGL